MVFRLIVLRVRHLSDKRGGENKKHSCCSISFFSKTLAAYEIMWNNIAEPDRPHSECVVLIAFPL
jgi:hypothetical protein